MYPPLSSGTHPRLVLQCYGIAIRSPVWKFLAPLFSWAGQKTTAGIHLQTLAFLPHEWKFFATIQTRLFNVQLPVVRMEVMIKSGTTKPRGASTAKGVSSIPTGISGLLATNPRSTGFLHSSSPVTTDFNAKSMKPVALTFKSISYERMG
jgi:hypothetical protein